MKNFKLKFVSLLTLLTVSQLVIANENPYCIAVRGNGELEPAHWGAMAQSLEKFGAASAIAGGSSGSITSFFWESMMANPTLSAKSSDEQSRDMALMFKSLEGYSLHLVQQKKWATLLNWLKLSEDSGIIKMVQHALSILTNVGSFSEMKDQETQIKEALKSFRDSGIFNGPAVRAVTAAYRNAEKHPLSISAKKALFSQLQDFKNSLLVFGKFDAKSDTQLLIRDGLIDFTALGESLGIMADFLALRNADQQAIKAFQKFLSDCSTGTLGLTWRQIIAQKPICQSDLYTWIDSYVPNYKMQKNSRIFDKVSQYAPVVVSTAVISNDVETLLRKPGTPNSSAELYRSTKAKYDKTHDPKLGSEMQMDLKDLHFGYWSSSENLNSISKNLTRDTDKNQRFMPLGNATWRLVLGLSPAEPGLSSYLNFKSELYQDELISVGGWSDLHPIPVLKATGLCSKVVYITRRGGDSLFAIGVAKKILGLSDIAWNLLETNKTTDQQKQDHDASIAHNMNGEPLRSPLGQWSKMFNLRNTQSSFANSIAQADAIVCTNWDHFDIKSDFYALIDDAYTAPIYMKQLSNTMTHILTLEQRERLTSGGYPEFAGCIPLQ